MIAIRKPAHDPRALAWCAGVQRIGYRRNAARNKIK